MAKGASLKLRIGRLALCVLLIFGTVTPFAAAKELYVDGAAGNDAVSYEDNGPTSPWASIGRAAWGSTNRGAPNPSQAARAGDTVHVLPGVYYAPGTGARNQPALNPVNNGAIGSPLVFLAHGRVTLRLSSDSGPIAGCLSRNDVVWNGFFIDEVNSPSRPDTGPVVVWASLRCVIERFEIRGINPNWGDNHNGIRVEGSNFTIIRDNLIYGQRGTSGGANDAGIMLYDSNDTLIEHNEIYDVGTGVFVKGQHPGLTQRRTIIRFNHIYNIANTGITLGPATRDGRTYQNLIRDTVNTSAAGIKLYDMGAGEGAEPINEIIANNTLVNVRFGLHFLGDGQNNVLANNVVAANSPGAPVWSWSHDTPLSLTFDRNCYSGGSTFFADVNRSWAHWQNTFGQDRNGVYASPSFLNASAGNYRLSSGSPCLSVGRAVGGIGGPDGTVISAGAYITGTEVLGRRVDSPTTAPASPTGVRILQ